MNSLTWDYNKAAYLDEYTCLENPIVLGKVFQRIEKKPVHSPNPQLIFLVHLLKTDVACDHLNMHNKKRPEYPSIDICGPIVKWYQEYHSQTIVSNWSLLENYELYWIANFVHDQRKKLKKENWDRKEEEEERVGTEE